MNPIQAAISKISNVARQKFGDNQGWVQNNRISAQPLRQAFATPTDAAYTISRVFTGNPLTRQQYHSPVPQKQAPKFQFTLPKVNFQMPKIGGIDVAKTFQYYTGSAPRNPQIEAANRNAMFNPANMAKNYQNYQRQNNVSTPLQTLIAATKQSANTLPQNFPAYVRNVSQQAFGKTAGNIIAAPTANTGQAIAQGAKDIYQGGKKLVTIPELIRRKKYGEAAQTGLEGGAKIFFGGAKNIAAATPLFQVFNVMSGMDNKVGELTRAVAGGMAGGERFDPNAKRTKVNVMGMEVEPIEGVGQMIGFVKNPAWQKIYPLTSQILKVNPTASGVANFIFQRVTKGGLEAYIQALSQMPENPTDDQKWDYIKNNVLLGAGAELGFDTLGKGANSLKNKQTIVRLMDTISNEYRRANILVYDAISGKRMPMWEYRLRDQSGAIDLNAEVGNPFKGMGEDAPKNFTPIKNIDELIKRAKEGVTGEQPNTPLSPVEPGRGLPTEGAMKPRTAKKADEIISDYQMSKEMYDSARLAIDADRRVLARVKNALNQYDKRQSDEVAFSKSKMWKKYGGDVMSAYNSTHGDKLGGVDEYAAINWLRELPNIGQKPTISRSDKAIISNLNRQSKQIEKQVEQQARLQQKVVNAPIDEAILLSGYNKNKLKTRGFTETVQKAEQTKSSVAKKVSGQYEVITNPESLLKAKTQIANNYDEARSRVFESKDWDADVAAIGQELMRKAQANKQWTEAVNIAETIAMKATKAGQGNQALSMWGRMTPEGMLQFATKTIRKANEEQSQITKGIKNVLRIAPTKLDERSASVIDSAMRMANKANNEEDRVRFVRVAMDEIQSHIPYGISDLLDELRYNNMLSSPLTHVRNAWSNSIQVGLVRPTVLLMQGKPKAVAQYYKGVATNVAPAVENAIKALSGKVPYKPLEIELKGKLRAKPKLGLYNIPTRLLEASDQLFTTLVRGGEMARGVNKQEADAIAEGLLFRASTHPKGQGQLLNAIDAVADSVGSLRSKGLGWFIPFIRTPMNVAKQWIEYSPAGLLTLPGAANKKEQLAKSLIGSVATLMGAKLAMEGKTTWSAPEDQKERKLFYDSGRKPYSVKIGDKWVPMQYTGTFAWAVGIPAALQYYQTQQRRALTEDQVEKITKGLLSLGGFWSQQTFVSGLGSFVNTMQGKDDYTVTKSLAYTASQINPMAGLQRYIANVIDPIFRKPTTFVQQLQSGVPIMTKNLPYYETSTGEPAKRNISDYIAPYAIKFANPEFEQPYLEKQKRIQENAYINAYTKEDKNIPQPLREKAEKMELDRKAQDGWNYYSAKLKEYNKTKDAKTGSSLYYGIKNSKRLTPEMKEDLLKELPTPKTKGKTKTTSAKTKVKKVKASKSKKAKIKKIKTPKLSAKLPKRKKIKIAKIKTNKFKSLQSPKFAKIKTRSSKNLT